MITSRDNTPNYSKVVNTAGVPHRSPFRYPGGKTWFVPFFREWVKSLERRPRELVEPFAGGGIIGLTAVAENLVDKVTLCEIDPDVAAVWETMLGEDVEWLINRILGFQISRQSVISELKKVAKSRRSRAFQALLRNRVQRGGIMAPGAALVKNGENGKGVASRWYPETLARRIRDIIHFRERISFVNGDGIQLIRKFARRKTAAFFIDPPYTASGKRAGRRLYSCSELDHDELLRRAASVSGSALMTYDDTSEITNSALRHGLSIEYVPMKNTHHAVVCELAISNRGRCRSPERIEQLRLAL
jgi:DNA adenine methylase